MILYNIIYQGSVGGSYSIGGVNVSRVGAATTDHMDSSPVLLIPPFLFPYGQFS